MKILTNAASNPKTKKLLDKFKYEAAILHLAPNILADGKHTVCPWATPGCIATCLNTSGRSQVTGSISTQNLKGYMIHRARIAKTLMYLNERESFMYELKREIRNLSTRAKANKKKCVVRLNGTSDLPWENTYIVDDSPHIQFYDYTKSYTRMLAFLSGKFPKNYYLIFSRSENTEDKQIKFITKNKGNVAVVFRGELPSTYLGIPVINGDEHDFRFRDKRGVIVGLKAKGRAKKDTTGFVI